MKYPWHVRPRQAPAQLAASVGLVQMVFSWLSTQRQTHAACAELMGKVIRIVARTFQMGPAPENATEIVQSELCFYYRIGGIWIIRTNSERKRPDFSRTV